MSKDMHPTSAPRLCLAIPLLIAGCRANAFDSAPIESRFSWGVVRGYTTEDIEQVIGFARELVPQVQALLEPAHAQPLQIVVVPESPSRRADAYTSEVTSGFPSRVVVRFIVLGLDAPGPRRFLLAHELVHWYADGVWQHLPVAVEEGMADMIASQFNPELGAVHAAFLGRLGEPRPQDIQEMLAIKRGEEVSLDSRHKDMLYLVGAQIAEHCGVKGLRAWCEEAQRSGVASVPLDWIPGQ